MRTHAVAAFDNPYGHVDDTFASLQDGEWRTACRSTTALIMFLVGMCLSPPLSRELVTSFNDALPISPDPGLSGAVNTQSGTTVPARLPASGKLVLQCRGS